MRKRIAVLAAQIDENTQKQFLTQFIQNAYAHDIDVCIFSMHLKYQTTELRDIGDSNIFELINYDLFDAVLIMLDTILTPGFADTLQKKVKESFHGPVLVLDQMSPYFESVMIDHYTPVKKLVDHLIEVHGYKDIAFLGGKKGHIHSVQRLNAYQDSMREHGLKVKKEWVYHGNYWYDSAEEFANKLLSDRAHMPRALACANDHMAIGAAVTFSENGLRVPEDIAIVGYDSVEDGRHSPVPLTSADIPAKECGAYCLEWLYAAMNGLEKPEFKPNAPIYIGGSCGCDFEIEMVPSKLRHEWRTVQTSRSIYSDFNHAIEDLLSQTDLTAFLDQVQDYTYQIPSFTEFYLCLNDTFFVPGKNIGEQARRKGYSDRIHQVLSCNSKPDEKNEIDLSYSFDVKELLPAMYKERNYPTTYIFNPVYFDDRCFGYTVINYGKEAFIYDETFRIWVRNVMQGMEAFYRQRFLMMLVEQIKANQIRDTLTGLYNYQGFLKLATELTEQKKDTDEKIFIIAIDVKGLKQINEIYGREVGDKAIRAVARFIQESVHEDEIASRMCNDEFLIAHFCHNECKRGEQLLSHIQDCLQNYSLTNESEFLFDIEYAMLYGKPETLSDLETLINQTISVKNHKKAALYQHSNTLTRDTLDEIKRNQLVDHILNSNMLTYYFQPIVRVRDGSIYAYEALMRCEQENISPSQILQAATYLNRLYDIEKATLFNVTGYVQDNLEKFHSAKVFVNSLPGYQLRDEDYKILCERIKHATGRFVIEFTEESELNDKQLAEFMRKYSSIGSEIALDDFGTGYSNMNNLIRYMPQYVKIDRSLITEIQDNPQKQHFVRSIIEYAHDNQILALAEGVETSEELRACIGLGADLIQGYYTGKPSKEPLRKLPVNIFAEMKRYQISRDGWSFMQFSDKFAE